MQIEEHPPVPAKPTFDLLGITLSELETIEFALRQSHSRRAEQLALELRPVVAAARAAYR